MNYIDTITPEIKEYFKILEPEFPEWVNEYINTPAMQRLQYITVACGKTYSKLFDEKDYNTLDHSIGVALIVWHFTHDKKQTLSGLFHDIATPVFKHTIDFMNGDYMNQESTEDLTTKIIESSTEITNLLKRDNIQISEVCDYHIYPIADNDTPKLSSDRLEYTLSNGHFVYDDITLEQLKNIYNNLEIQTNEDGIDEIAFRTKEMAELFAIKASNYAIKYRTPETRYSMQLIADILKIMNEQSLITIDDLYNLKELEVVDLIKSCTFKDINKKYKIWLNSTEVHISNQEPAAVYYVHHGAKIRYIDPLCNGCRISTISEEAKNAINHNFNYPMDEYIYLDFEL